ncbi:MAG: hypothetical protein ABF904_09110 [Ethanoligenens sp.]
MLDKDDVLLFLVEILATVVLVGAVAWMAKIQLDQTHRDYIAAIKIDMSDLKVGQSINLQNYDIDLKSGNPNILQVRTSNDGGLFSDNENVIWGVSAGNTTLMIHDESSNAYKIVKIEVVK